MWVDIANLMGPKGADGADGQKGDPGPVNIGLNPDEPLVWDQSGGFRFRFVDGSEQTVNLPIASAQSAGLLGAGGSLPTTGARDITSLIQATYLKSGQAGKLVLDRVGPMVTLTFDLLGIIGTSWVVLTNLPAGFRPASQQHAAIQWGTGETAVSEYSACIIRVNGSISFRLKNDLLARGTIVFPTKDAFPSVLPGTPLT